MMGINQRAPNLHALQPDPLEPRAEEVERYVAALQELAESDPALAGRQAWSQIRLAGMRASRRRGEVLDSLNRIFRIATVPEPSPDGLYDGLVVTTTTFAATDPLFHVLLSLWMPWRGKRFDAKTMSGDNMMLPGARVPAKLVWPSYRFQDTGQGRYAAFRFRSYPGAGTLDHDRRVLKIDYDSGENPSFLIRDILDELVQIVPGVYLGKVLLRSSKPSRQSRRLVAYFTLRPAALDASFSPSISRQ
jgi:hypothetical protein